jgi:FtsZ-binding cell division protein ZapB
VVPAFDLLPPAHARRQAWGRRRYRALALPLGIGLMAGLMILAQIQSHLDTARESEALAQAEVGRLKSHQRQLQAQWQAQQAWQAIAQAHRQQVERWSHAGVALRAVSRPLGPPARARLLELRLDDQGLLLTGQIGPAQLQPWLDGLRAGAPALGVAWLMEIGPSPSASSADDEADALSRFVVRFPQKTSPPAQVSP